MKDYWCAVFGGIGDEFDKSAMRIPSESHCLRWFASQPWCHLPCCAPSVKNLLSVEPGVPLQNPRMNPNFDFMTFVMTFVYKSIAMLGARDCGTYCRHSSSLRCGWVMQPCFRILECAAIRMGLCGPSFIMADFQRIGASKNRWITCSEVLVTEHFVCRRDDGLSVRVRMQVGLSLKHE